MYMFVVFEFAIPNVVPCQRELQMSNTILCGTCVCLCAFAVLWQFANYSKLHNSSAHLFLNCCKLTLLALHINKNKHACLHHNTIRKCSQFKHIKKRQTCASTLVVEFAIPIANYYIWYHKFKTHKQCCVFEFVIPTMAVCNRYCKFKNCCGCTCLLFLNLQYQML